MNYYQVTAPSTEPITLDETKLFLRVDSDVEDTLISALITTARQKVESDTWRALITQTWKLSLDKDEVKTFIGITKSPIQAVSHIKYFDINVIQQTLSTGGYQANLLNEPAIIKLSAIPQMADIMNAMEIQFTCGYGVASSVPQALKEAIKLLIGHYYEHREAVSTTNMSELPLTYDNLINPYRVLFYPYN